MSPELLQIHTGEKDGEFNAEKCDIFSLGLTFLRKSLILESEKGFKEFITLDDLMRD